MDSQSSAFPRDDRLYPVAIAGGGVVGLTLALALASRDIKCAVIDEPVRIPADISGGRYFLISSGCWRIWRSLGLEDQLLAVSEPVVRLTAYCGDGNLSVSAEEATGEPVLGFMIAETALMAILVQRVKGSSQIALVGGGRVSAVQAEGSEVRVCAADLQFRARLVAGCDGLRSRVRQVSGIRFEGWDYGLKAVTAMIQLERDHEGVARQVFLRRGPLAMLPLRDGRANLVWTQPYASSDALMGLSGQDFLAEASLHFGALMRGARLIGDRSTFPLGLHVADRFHGDRVVLAGDSAHQIHPLAGQGLNLGLKDVAALVDVISDAQRIGLDIGSPSVLSNYTRWRRSDVSSTAAAMEGLSSLFTSPPLVRGVVGSAMGLVGSSAFVRKWLMREAGAETGELPSLMRA